MSGTACTYTSAQQIVTLLLIRAVRQHSRNEGVQSQSNGVPRFWVPKHEGVTFRRTHHESNYSMHFESTFIWSRVNSGNSYMQYPYTKRIR
jgi:hypothetical protein